MATMEQLITDVQTELRFGAGTGVQIHLQDGIAANISRLYRTLMKKHIWRDYYATTSLVIDETTGQSTTAVTSFLTSFSNILAIYRENEQTPVPFAPLMVNPYTLKRPAITPSGDAKIFTIWPKQAKNIVLISRNYQETDFELTDVVPFYRDVLTLGASWMLAVKSGVNRDLTRSLEEQFKDTVNIYRLDEFKSSYQINPHMGSYPTEWYVNE